MPVGIFKDFLHGVYTAFKLAKEIELEQSDPFAFFNSEFFPTRFSFGLSALSSCKYKSAVSYVLYCLLRGLLFLSLAYTQRFFISVQLNLSVCRRKISYYKNIFCVLQVLLFLPFTFRSTIHMNFV